MNLAVEATDIPAHLASAAPSMAGAEPHPTIAEKDATVPSVLAQAGVL